MKNGLLVLDDDRMVLDMLKESFKGENLEVYLADNAVEALACLKRDRPNVALIDIHIPETSGLAVLREAKAIDPNLQVIIMTGNGTTQAAIEAMKSGAYDLVTKPFNFQQLKELVNKAIEHSKWGKKVKFSNFVSPQAIAEQDVDVMIGSSPEMMEIWKMVGRVADSDATVLILGESGTGKELLARAIYNNSRRSNGQFLAVNCAALVDTLLESELFGHEKGAFTDAHARKIGKFEQCNGGTIFLDEIGEMSLANQGKLLRFLETQQFERVGGNETIHVDVRIIAATNRSLISAVKEKSFRLDLFYRLRIITFYMPPLRDRKEDIPFLVDLFIRKYSAKYGKQVKGIVPEALEMLMDYHWEGNIRELQNIIISAILLSNESLLLPENLFKFQTESMAAPPPAKDLVGDDVAKLLRSMLEPVFDTICKKCNGRIVSSLISELERILIMLAMKKCDQNQVAAASLLGISRNTLRDRIEKHNLHGNWS